ncbi:MAG: EAL domain-containing protein [Lachnospiraceae bacterium]|nr:EAL domain-containing protein [Lachnospiraceae bacterium]
MIIIKIPDNEFSDESKALVSAKIDELRLLSSSTNILQKGNNQYIYLHGESYEEDRKSYICEIEKEIIDAIITNRIVIYLQPIYSIKDKAFVSAEVLARIIKKDNNILMPAEFIPVAEELGIISDIEDVVLKKTCEFLKENDIRQLGLKYLEINLSVKNGQKKNFAKKYLGTMIDYGIDPSLLNFEVTETAVVSRKEHLIKNMNEMIDEGSRFSLDDFGARESNLNYVIDMPIKFIKFDRDMTNAFVENEKAKCVMQHTIEMAHELGLKTISEGVETYQMLQDMQDIGIDYIQGFFFSKPLPIPDFLKFINDNKD